MQYKSRTWVLGSNGTENALMHDDPRRLLAKQGRQDEAHRMLAEVYSWFTEGFETPDLKDAKALLDVLAAA